MKTLYDEHMGFEQAIRFAATNKIKIELDEDQKHIEKSINYCFDYRYKLANDYLNSNKTEPEYVEIFKKINTNIIEILGLKPNYNELI